MFNDPKLQRLYRSLVFEISSVPIANALSTLGFAFRAFEGNGPITVWANQPPITDRAAAYQLGLSQWELETMLREILIHAPLYGTGRISDWNKLALISNKLKAVCNEAWPEGRGEDLVFFELFRIPHRQFSWQRSLSSAYLNRYLYLYTRDPMDTLLQAELNLTGAECVLAAFTLHAFYLNNLYADGDFDLELVGIDTTRSKALLDRISISREEVVAYCERQIPNADLNFEYLPSVFVERPLMSLTSTEGRRMYYCPIPRHLMSRLVDGLYFEIIGSHGFENAYGAAFQSYVSDLAKNSLPGRYSVLDEQKYGSTRLRKDSIDVIIEDQSATLFVECKTRRVKRVSKVDLSDRDITYRQLDALVDIFVQSYVTVHDGMQGEYPHWSPKSRPSYLLVVLLTPWHVFSHVLWGYITDQVQTKLEAQNVPSTILTEIPATVCSAEEFEQLCSVLNAVSLDTVFGLKTDSGYSQWALDTFLREQHFEPMKEHIERVQSGAMTLSDLLETIPSSEN